ncbi:hypothetical protein J6590_076270 [Homalodisca vitripennis]|nr:hypothetical protein J6590_076270 [Homalodisca vitripennis]
MTISTCGKDRRVVPHLHLAWSHIDFRPEHISSCQTVPLPARFVCEQALSGGSQPLRGLSARPLTPCIWDAAYLTPSPPLPPATPAAPDYTVYSTVFIKPSALHHQSVWLPRTLSKISPLAPATPAAPDYTVYSTVFIKHSGLHHQSVWLPRTLSKVRRWTSTNSRDLVCLYYEHNPSNQKHIVHRLDLSSCHQLHRRSGLYSIQHSVYQALCTPPPVCLVPRTLSKVRRWTSTNSRDLVCLYYEHNPSNQKHIVHRLDLSSCHQLHRRSGLYSIQHSVYQALCTPPPVCLVTSDIV